MRIIGLFVVPVPFTTSSLNAGVLVPIPTFPLWAYRQEIGAAKNAAKRRALDFIKWNLNF
jgi:hypothetical protein